jgi:hypoxanthine phosphoribosyltransferase
MLSPDKVIAPREKMFISYLDVNKWVDDIVDKMLPYAKFTHILAIGKGGLVPAAMIAYRFDELARRACEMSVVYASSYDREVRHDIATTLTIHDKQQLPSQAGQLLIVDDIADSGATLAHFLRAFPLAKTAVLVHKDISMIKPDYCGRVDKAGDKYWYVFPWERD